jgi:hypothetical protein
VEVVDEYESELERMDRAVIQTASGLAELLVMARWSKTIRDARFTQESPVRLFIDGLEVAADPVTGTLAYDTDSWGFAGMTRWNETVSEPSTTLASSMQP